jgi:hypothetical protein
VVRQGLTRLIEKVLLEAARLYGKCNFMEADLRLLLYNADNEKVEKPTLLIKTRVVFMGYQYQSFPE